MGVYRVGYEISDGTGGLKAQNSYVFDSWLSNENVPFVYSTALSTNSIYWYTPTNNLTSNGFWDSTTVPAAMDVSLEIYNITGQRIRTIESAISTLGEHSIVWDGRDEGGLSTPSGVYLYGLKGGGFVAHGRMSLMK